jgi:N-acetylneuraminic acid mutarotase
MGGSRLMRTRFRLSPALLALFFITLIATAASASAGDPWLSGTPTPFHRGEAAAAALDGKIYLIGGFTVFGVTNRVEAYDPKSGKWQERAPLPVALHHAGVAVINKKIYVVGGFDGLMFWEPLHTVWEYNPRRDEWKAKKEMPTARGALSVGVWKGKLYAVGGYGETPFGKGNLGANEVYDPLIDKWELKSPLPIARDHLAVAVVNGKIHAMGGRFQSSSSRNLSLHDVYDPETDAWSAAAPLRKPRSGVAAAVLQGKIHLFGGEAPDGTHPDHDIYDPAADAWAPGPPMPTARHGLAAVAVEDKIYLLTGGQRPGTSISNSNEIFRPG